LEDITKNIKDYNIFEETITSINNELNSISNSLSNFNQSSNEKTEYFENYSTKEERNIHDKVVNNEDNFGEEHKTAGNDVELF
ncbi:MAG: hypothetical protein KAG95_04160, partial [Bacteroidales bacterium]|nr:hypothetical protein [Bacteroidales bacterium]